MAGALPLLEAHGLDVPALPSREEIDRQRIRDWYAAQPLRLRGAPPLREPGQHGVPPAPGRDSYTRFTDEERAVRSRFQMALRVGPAKARTLHRAAELHRDHGEWARAELHRRRADGTARTWGVDVEDLDAVLAAAGVPPAGEYLATIGGES